MPRKYSFSDSVLLESAGKTHEILDEDLPDFTSFDPDLNGEKRSTLMSRIDQALAIGTDAAVRAKMKAYTDAVNKAMSNCQQLFSHLRYFVRKAFKDEPAIQRQFGFNEYRKVRQKQDKLIVFFTELIKPVAQYRDRLTAAGATEELLDGIQPAAKALTKANAEQEAFVDSQPVKTAARDQAFNSLYDLLLEFSDAAEIVYAAEPARRSQYSLPHNDSPSDEDV